MPGLGADIKEVYTELGAETHIVSRTPVVTGERVIYEINSQATKPFIREHHLDATLPFDTLITTNDVVRIVEANKNYMVMNKTPELFEDSIVEWSAVLYMCNLVTTAHILRPIETRNMSSFNMESGWGIVHHPPIYGLMTDRIFGSEIDQNSVFTGQVPIWRVDLYLPKYYNLKPLDRLYLTDAEYYKVEAIEDYSYPGVGVALLVEDTRPFVSISDIDIYYEDEY
jgi:hypothetical protein